MEAAYDLAQRSRTLRVHINELARKAAHLREASKKVRNDLDRNGNRTRQNNPTGG